MYSTCSAVCKVRTDSLSYNFQDLGLYYKHRIQIEWTSLKGGFMIFIEFFLRPNRIGAARKKSWHPWKGSILMRFEVIVLAITLQFSKMTKIDVMRHVLTLKIGKVVRNIKEDCILGENCRATRGCFNGYIGMYFMTTFTK